MKTITLKSGKSWPVNTAFNGDCLDFMRELPDKCIDMVLTDPPYGIGITKSNRLAVSRGMGGKSWDDEIPTDEIFGEIFRISKHQIIWGGNYFNLPPSRNFIIWDKNNYGRDFADCELGWCSIDAVARIVKKRPMNMDGGKIHPTQKPLKLFKWCLEKYAPKDAIVFDPFLGSFTTAVACHSHGLNWIDCEKDDDYFKAGMNRYETECLQGLLEFS